MRSGDEQRIEREPADDGDHVVHRPRRRARQRPRRTALQRDAIGDGPDEKAAEQQHVGERAVGQQMGEGPQLHRGEHRVLGRGLDAARQIRGEQQREHRQHQQQRDVMHPVRRRVQNDRRLACEAVAVDQQHEADDRCDRVDALPRSLAAPRHLAVAPRGGEDGHRMDAEKQHEAEDEQAHGDRSGSGGVRSLDQRRSHRRASRS